MSYATLDDVSGFGFSETARSCPGHGEAGGDRHDGSAAAVGGWRLADDVAEDPAEGAEAAETDVEADVGHAAIGRAQQEHRAFDSTPLQVPVWRLAKGCAERSDEVRLRDVRNSSEGGQVERLGIGAVHGIARAEHSAVDLLNGAAHAG